MPDRSDPGDPPARLPRALRRRRHQHRQRPDHGGRAGRGRGAAGAADRPDLGQDRQDGSARDVLYAMWVEMTRDVTVPVALHLDHCPDREVISACLAQGWNSVLFDASKLSVEENRAAVHRGRRRGAPLRRRGRGRDRGHQGRRGRHRVRRRRARSSRSTWRSTSSAPPGSTASRRPSATPTACTRPRRTLDDQRVSDIVAAEPIPIALHGGTGMTPDAVQRPHRARLRQGQHLDGAQDPLHAVGLRLHDRAPRRVRPAGPLPRPARRRDGDGQRPHPACSAARARRGDARSSSTATASSPTPSASATCRPSTQTFREFGLPVQWSEEEYGRLLRIGGGKERMATLLTPAFVAAAGPARPTPRARRPSSRRWHARKTAIYTEMVAAGPAAAAAGDPRGSSARRRTPAGRWPWPRPPPRPRSAPSSTCRRAGARGPLRPRPGGRRGRAQEAGAGHLPAGPRAAGRRARSTRSSIEDSRNGLLAAVGGRAALPRDGQRLHRGRGRPARRSWSSRSLGDPGGEAHTVLANRSAATPGRLGHPGRPRGLPARRSRACGPRRGCDPHAAILRAMATNRARAAGSPAHRRRAGACPPIPDGAGAAVPAPDVAGARPRAPLQPGLDPRRDGPARGGGRDRASSRGAGSARSWSIALRRARSGRPPRTVRWWSSLPLASSPRYEALATAIKQLLTKAGLEVFLIFVRGSRQRLQAVRDGRCHLTVMSSFAAAELCGPEDASRPRSWRRTRTTPATGSSTRRPTRTRTRSGSSSTGTRRTSSC